jgi:Ca2+-binding EF-hand superfamily protein
MTSSDFVRSLLPYRPIASTADLTKDPNSPGTKNLNKALDDLTKLADRDGNGLIDFSEYLFFLTLLSTPDHLFELAFQILDEDGNQKLDYREFGKVMTAHSSALHARMGKQERPIFYDGKETKLSGMMALMFGDRGTKQITLNEFRGLIKSLRMNLLKCEFYQFDVDAKGTIGVQDFACTMLSYTSSGDLPDYIRKAETLPQSNKRVSFDQFVMFDHITRETESIELAMTLFTEIESMYPDAGGLSKKDFKRTIKAIVGYEMDDVVVDTIFWIFDANGDGHLDAEEFVDAVKGRRFRGLNQAKPPNLIKYFKSVYKCASELA